LVIGHNSHTYARSLITAEYLSIIARTHITSSSVITVLATGERVFTFINIYTANERLHICMYNCSFHNTCIRQSQQRHLTKILQFSLYNVFTVYNIFSAYQCICIHPLVDILKHRSNSVLHQIDLYSFVHKLQDNRIFLHNYITFITGNKTLQALTNAGIIFLQLSKAAIANAFIRPHCIDTEISTLQ